MADWVKGDIELSGNRSNLIQFLLNGIRPMGNTIEINNDSSNFEMKTSDNNYLIANSDRHYLSSDNISLNHQQIQKLECEFVAEDEIDTQLLESISQNFSIDIEIWGEDTNGDFRHKIHIVSGKIVQDDIILT